MSDGHLIPGRHLHDGVGLTCHKCRHCKLSSQRGTFVRLCRVYKMHRYPIVELDTPACSLFSMYDVWDAKGMLGLAPDIGPAILVESDRAEQAGELARAAYLREIVKSGKPELIETKPE